MKNIEKIIKFCDYGLKFSLIFYILCAIVTTSGVEIASCFLFLFWLIRTIISRKLYIPHFSLNIFILILITVIFISTIFSPCFLKSLNKFKLIIGQIGFYFLCLTTLKDSKQINQLLLILKITVFLSCLFGLWQYFFKIDLFAHGFERISSNAIRIQSTLDAPNAFGGSLAMLIPLVFSSILYKKNKFRYGILFFLMLINLIFTFSRGSYIAAIGSIIILVILSKRKISSTLVYLLILILLIISSLLFFSSSFKARIYSILQVELNQNRIHLFKGAIEMFKQRPLLGIGPGNFLFFYTQQHNLQKTEVPLGERVNSCHNNFLQLAAEGGIFALISFILVLSVFFYQALKVLYNLKNQDTHLHTIILGIIGGVVAFTIHGLVDYTFGLVSTSHLFWFFLAISCIIKKEHHNAKIKNSFI